MIIDTHMHLWDRLDGRLGVTPVKPVGNGVIRIGKDRCQGMPSWFTDCRNPAELAVAAFDDAGVNAAVVTQEFMDGNQNGYLLKVKKKYPNIYRVLVSERNKIMAKNLLILMKKEPDKKILAIIGAGHEKEMIELIKKKKNSIEVIPLNITSSTGNYSINYLNTHS